MSHDQFEHIMVLRAERYSVPDLPSALSHCIAHHAVDSNYRQVSKPDLRKAITRPSRTAAERLSWRSLPEAFERDKSVGQDLLIARLVLIDKDHGIGFPS
jgi:hypothetical protein